MQNFSSSYINLSCPDPCSDTHRSLHRRLLSTLPWFPRAFFQQHAVQRLNPSVIFKLRRAESRSFPASPFNPAKYTSFSFDILNTRQFSYNFFLSFLLFILLLLIIKIPIKISQQVLLTLFNFNEGTVS